MNELICTENQVKHIEFRGSKIPTTYHEGTVYISPKWFCNNLRIDWGTQRRRILNDPLFSYGYMTTTGFDKKQYKMIVIPLEQLDGWLYKINASKIKNEDVRENLLAYQRECSSVLFRYWNKKYKLMLVDKTSPEYQLVRNEGKKERRNATDCIKSFVEYAMRNGSKRADNYYQGFSTLIKKCVGYESDREYATPDQQVNAIILDKIIVALMDDLIDQKLDYHNIYRIIAKDIRELSVKYKFEGIMMATKVKKVKVITKVKQLELFL